MTCPRCQQENPGHARFCLGCGSRLADACTRCGADLSGGARFCAQCGHQVGTPPSTVEARFASPGAYTPKHLAEKILTSKGALEGERKPVTVLFCDIAGSTATAERVGPEGMHRLLREFFELALAQVHRYEGTINQFLGDGFMALFGAPLAHEDHARRAVLAALGIQRALRDQQAEVPNERSLALRMGLNTGFVVVGSIGDNLRMDYTAVGDTTHLAARLQQLAQPGMILLGESTARLVTGYVRLQALDPVSVKGRTEPVPVYRLEGLGRRRSPLDGIEERALTPFVGRDRELAMLRDLLAEVEAGEGRVVGIVGEPGVGKSRLLLEFRRTLAGRPVTFLEGRCLSFGSAIPYLPVVDIIRNNCGVVETDTPEAIAKKVRLGLEEVGLDGTESAPYLLHLLGVREGTERLGGLSPEAIQARTFETLNQMSLHGSRHRPIICAIEDAHWIDRTSQEYLESLAESLAGARILLLATFRPGYRPPWVEKSYATQLSLHRLAPADSLSVVRAVIPPDRMSDPVARLILEKAEGNPFFLEEMARAVTEQSGAPANLSVPDTVHGVLMARIDRLPEEAKRVLQTASVLGREFSVPLLGALVEGGGAFEQHLLDLKRLEFVYERTTGAETVYVFKHALTQDVAYESLLESRRRVLHAAAGRALETLYADRLDDVYERLAHHYARAEAADKAVEYLVRSAEKAARVYANADAVRALEEALVHAERLPLPERDRHIVNIVTRLANSLYFLGRFEQTREVLRERQACVERLQDPALAGPYYFWLAHTYNHLGEHDLVATSAEQAIQAAERCGDEATLGKTYHVLAREAVFSARFRQGLEHGQRAVALLERTDERLWLGQSHCWVGINSCLLGRLDAALDAAARGRAIGVESGDARTESYATWNRGWFFTTRGEWENGVEACRQSLQRSPDPFNSAAATGWLGYAYLEKGDPVAAIPLLEQSLQQWRQFGHETLLGWFGAWLSEAYLLGDRIDEARELAMQSLEISEAASNWSGVGWCQRALGRITHSSGAHSAAKRHLEVAAQTFARIDARFEEARTRLVLAEVAHAAGEREAAIRHLELAHTAFLALQAPRYVAETEQRASGWRIQISGAHAG